MDDVEALSRPEPADGRLWRPWLGARGKDVALSGILLVLQFGASYGYAHHHDPRADLGIAGWLLLAVGPVALLAWRRYPVTVMWVTFAATLGPSGSRFAYLSLIVSFFLVATNGHRRAAWIVIVVGYVGSLWLAPLLWRQSQTTLDGALLLGGWLAVLVVAAEAVRMRRERVAAARVTRRADEQRQASEERLRMARDLHDLIGHNISLINVQAAVGLDLANDHPDQAAVALTAIKAASKDALGELRSMLAALRQDGEDAPRSPTPGLERLPELIDRTRTAGISVTMKSRGAPRPLPAAVDIAAYRIVQEALTNVVRHAGPVRTTVLLSYDDEALLVEVSNDGRSHAIGLPEAGAGSGIAGMRERAVALGGHLDAGPRTGGGFSVRARLPFGGQS